MADYNKLIIQYTLFHYNFVFSKYNYSKSFYQSIITLKIIILKMNRIYIN